MSALPDLLRARFDMVARLSQITSQLQRFRQARMAADMDAQRCEMAQDDATHELRQEWDDALARAQAADDDIVASEARIAEIEAELDAADREIATLSGRRASS